MFALARTVVWATLFVALVLILLPQSILNRTGIVRPDHPGPLGWAGLALSVAGAALALWCILTFVVVGKGTPAPFDPPRRLVTRGPYRHVRNPMYEGALLALAGAALYYRSMGLLAYAGIFAIATHIFVVAYEEPTLKKTFGHEYEEYRSTVRRWIPRA